MKKLLLLLLIPFLLGGCYDYNELNELALISGVGIDYENDNYVVTFEIISTKKEGEASGSSNTYNVTADAPTITEAFAKNGNNLDKIPYYDHIEVVIISEEIAESHLKEVSEYLIRSSKLRNEFTLVMAKDNTAKEIISTSSTEHPIASSFIVNLLEHSSYSDSAGYSVPYTKTLRNILTEGEDAIISTFKLKDKEIVLDGMAIFKDYNLVHIFNTDDAALINLLVNYPTKTVFFEHTCQNNKKIIVSLYESKVGFDVSKEKVTIKATLNGRINEDNCDYNLLEEETYKELENIFSKIITEKLDKIINEFKKNESNALSIGKIYYNKYREKDFFRWLSSEFDYDLNLKINKKGLVFEVK